MLITDFPTRQARAAGKRQALLKFLREEIYTSREVAGRVMGLESRQAVYKTLASMERDDLIKRSEISLDRGSITLWGITPWGQTVAFDPDSEEYRETYFEPSRVPLGILQHQLDLQLIRVTAEHAGWGNWIPGDLLGEMRAGEARPDAIARSPSGLRVAVELERSVKTHKRYQAVLSMRLQALKRGDFDRVVWVSPTADFARRLEHIIKKIEAVNVAGQTVRINPEAHHKSLLFTSYHDFPTCLGVAA